MRSRLLSGSLFNTAMVAAGRLAVTAASFLTTIILMRHFSPEQYGLLAVITTVMAVLPPLIDFGTSYSVVRFGALYKQTGNLAGMATVFQSIFWIRLAIGAVVVTVGMLLSPQLARLLMHDASGAAWLRWALAGAFVSSLVLFQQAILQTHEQFGRYQLLNTLDGLGRLLAIAIVVALVEATLQHITAIYILTPVVVFLVGVTMIRWDFLKARATVSVLRQLFHFSKWIVIANICLMAFSNLDILMLAAMRSSAETGIYNGAYKLAAMVQVLTISVTAVLMPKAAKLTDKRSLRRFLKLQWGYVTALAAALLPLIFFARPLILLLADIRYEGSAPVFRVLFLDNLVVLLLVPLLLWILAINRPQLYALLAVVELVINLVGNFLCIPIWGALGAAWVTMSARAVTGLMALYLTWRAFNQGDDSMFLKDSDQ